MTIKTKAILVSVVSSLLVISGGNAMENSKKGGKGDADLDSAMQVCKDLNPATGKAINSSMLLKLIPILKGSYLGMEENKKNDLKKALEEKKFASLGAAGEICQKLQDKPEGLKKAQPVTELKKKGKS